MRAGDILLAINEHNVGVFDDQYSIGRHTWFAAGQDILITYLRVGTNTKITGHVRAGSMPREYDVFAPTGARHPVYLREKERDLRVISRPVLDIATL